MNILNKLTIKHLLMNKRRTIVSIIGILLSTALMVGIGLIFSSIRDYTINETIANQGDYHVKINNVDKNKLYVIRNNRDIKKYYTEQVLGYSYYEESSNNSKPYYKIISASDSYLKQLQLKTGRYPNNDNEIVISDHIFSQGTSKLKVGDTITLNIGVRVIDGQNIEEESSYEDGETLLINKTKTYTVVGIVNRANYTFEPYSSPGFNIYTKSEEVLENANIYINYKNPNKASELTLKIYKNLGHDVENDIYDVEFHQSLLSMYGSSGYDNFDSFIVSTMIIVLLLISVACIIVIYNSFAISVMERKKQFGLFASIGTTKNQLRKTVLFEVLIVGTIGIILGVLSSYIGIGTVIYVINNLLKDVLSLKIRLVTYPLFVIIPVIFMIITVIISALIPMKKASSVSPIEAIRQSNDIKINKRKLKTLKITEKIFGVEGIIALKNIKRNKKKYRITIISLFISIVTFIAFSTYLEVGTKTSEYYISNIKYDIAINYSYEEEKSIELVNEILTNKDTLEYIISKRSHLNYKITNSKIYTNEYLKLNKDISKMNMNGINITSLDKKTYQKYLKKLNLKDGSIILANKMIDFDYSNGSRKLTTLNVFKGNNINLTFCDNNKLYTKMKDESYQLSKDVNETCQYEINNIYITDKYPSFLDADLTLYVNEETFDKIASDLNINNNDELEINKTKTVLIKANNFTKIDEIGNKINSESSSNYHNITEQSKTQKNIVIVIKILLYGFIALVTLIGVTSVFNTINTSIILRKKEFSILRSIGLSPKGFNKMIIYESIFFGLKSLLFGVPVGVLISTFIASSMREIVDFGNIYIPYMSIIYAVLGVFVIVLLTMWYSVRKIKKDNILDAIREENI